jgi:hypothetical protein
MDLRHTHDWRRPVRLVITDGIRKREHLCRRCGRRFFEIVKSGEYFAAYPGTLDFEPLAPEITARWLRQPCPGMVLRADIDAIRNRPRSDLSPEKRLFVTDHLGPGCAMERRAALPFSLLIRRTWAYLNKRSL